MADLVEIRCMLQERRLEWWEQWKLEGLAEGMQKGRQEGLAQGKQEGLAEGKREGILEGEARLLHRLLERRFGCLPAWAEERLVKATEEDLVRWGEYTLDTTVSLEQLLRS